MSFWQGSRYHVCPDFANFTMNLRIVFLYSPLIHCSAGKPLAFKFVVLCSHASCPCDIEWRFQDTSIFRTLCFFFLVYFRLQLFSQLCEAVELHLELKRNNLPEMGNFICRPFISKQVHFGVHWRKL